MTPDELLTKKDLENFREELLSILKPLIEKQTLQQQKWLRSKDVMNLLNVSAGTLQNLRVNGTLGYRRAGGILFYKAEDIDKMLANPEKKTPVRKK